MAVPKKYLHDRLILLLLSVNAFLALLASLVVVLRLDTGRPQGYIVQYRSNLGPLSGFKAGSISVFISFVIFAWLVFGLHTLLSVRTYHIRRHASLIVLGMATLLLVLSIIVSNSLLGMR